MNADLGIHADSETVMIRDPRSSLQGSCPNKLSSRSEARGLFSTSQRKADSSRPEPRRSERQLEIRKMIRSLKAACIPKSAFICMRIRLLLAIALNDDRVFGRSRQRTLGIGRRRLVHIIGHVDDDN